MSTHQEHFGRKFYQDKKTLYWISCDYSKENPRTRAHQWVWFNNHGKPPKGYHIHHINEDKSDNRIENLELIHGRRHLSHHMIHHMSNPINKKKAQERCEKIRPLTKEWHGSEEGKAWHKYHAIKCNFGNWEPKKYNCQLCNKEYESKLRSEKRTKFCSNNCKSKWRRQSGLDNISVKCKLCDKEFQKNKYSKQKFCSRICSSKKEIKLIPRDIRICEFCSKEFSIERFKKKRFCGYSCSAKISGFKTGERKMSM